MKIVTVRIDQETLPNNGQKVSWQNIEDHNNKVWKDGFFSLEESLFYSKDGKIWDFAENVIRWK